MSEEGRYIWTSFNRDLSIKNKIWIQKITINDPPDLRLVFFIHSDRLLEYGGRLSDGGHQVVVGAASRRPRRPVILLTLGVLTGLGTEETRALLVGMIQVTHCSPGAARRRILSVHSL